MGGCHRKGLFESILEMIEGLKIEICLSKDDPFSLESCGSTARIMALGRIWPFPIAGFYYHYA